MGIDQQGRGAALAAALSARGVVAQAPVEDEAAAREAFGGGLDLGGHLADLVYAAEARALGTHHRDREAEDAELALHAVAIHAAQVAALNIYGVVELPHPSVERGDNALAELLGVAAVMDQRKVVAANMAEKILTRRHLR